jgi:hypothetical protein
MLMHSVYFWLQDNLTTEQLNAFEEGLRSLAAIETAKILHVGKPVPADRPVVESSYTFGLIVGFDTQEGLDTYAVHPVHLAFVDEFKPYWTQIRVFDVN